MLLASLPGCQIPPKRGREGASSVLPLYSQAGACVRDERLGWTRDPGVSLAPTLKQPCSLQMSRAARRQWGFLA